MTGITLSLALCSIALGASDRADVRAAAAVEAASPDAFAMPAAWTAPDADEVKSRALAWLEENKAEPAALAKATEIWTPSADAPAETEILTRLTDTFALADERAAALVRLCWQPQRELQLPDQAWLVDAKTPPLEAANMRLLYGRWLVQQSLYDEARDQLAGLSPDDVVAPASLLFYQAVVYHSLLEKEAGLNAIGQLLDGAARCPQRYVTVARMMQQDLEGLEDETLGHIARRMDDIRRRLDLGRAGKKVQEVEGGVIESLDKMIKEIEDKQQQQQQQSSAGRGNLQPSQPAPDSRILGGKGRGEVTKRDIGSQSDWGDLPPKQREEALQQIGRELPSHYRDVVEQYFRKLAGEEK